MYDSFAANSIIFYEVEKPTSSFGTYIAWHLEKQPSKDKFLPIGKKKT